MRFPSFLLALLLLPSLLTSQIAGRVVDQEHHPVAYANVSLLALSDSSLLVGTQTDDEGRFLLELPAISPCLLRVSFLTFEDHTQLIEARQDLKDIVLRAAPSELAQVTVRSRRQLIRQSREGQIVDVAASTLSQGSNALQLLERSPGVLVDRRNGGFSLNGRSGTQVLLNGRETHLPLSDLLALLEGIGADNILRIELLANPSAKYNAEGTGGVINIVLATGSGDGTQGNFTQSVGYGYGVKGSTGLRISHGGTGFDVYGNYGFTYDDQLDGWAAVARSSTPALGDGQTDIRFESLNHVTDRNHNMTFGAARRLGEGGMLGGEILYNMGRAAERRKNTGRYLFADDTGLNADISVDGQTRRSNLVGSLNYTLDRSDTKWTAYANGIRYRVSSPLRVTNRYRPLNGDTLPPLALVFNDGSATENRTAVSVGVAGFDGEKQASETFKYGWGGKYSHSLTANEGELVSTDDTGELPRQSTDSRVREWIAAGYLSTDWQFAPGYRLLAGFRYEYWSRTFSDNQGANRNTGSLFPNVTLEREVGEGKVLRSRYQRRITRPGYADVTAFIVYNDPGSIFTGNPELRPAISDNVSFDLVVAPYTLTLGYAYETNPIARYQGIEDRELGIVRIKPQNIDFQREVYLQATLPWEVTPAWSITGSGTLARRHFVLTYTNLPARRTYTFYTVGVDQQWSIGKHLTAELSARYNGPQFNGTVGLQSFGWLNGGFRYRISDRHSLQFSVEDILKSSRVINERGRVTPEAYGNTGTVDYRSEAARFRIFRLSYSWRFGSTSQSSVRSIGGDADERARLGG
ncbi:MAG: outer membrane beta-barrel family protein [Lewinella sp.]